MQTLSAPAHFAPPNSVEPHAGKLRVVLLSKALVVGAYQRKAEAIAAINNIDLTVLVPPSWTDNRGRQVAAPCYTNGYDFHILPVRFGDNFHLHHYPTLAQALHRLRPHVLHVDEEPYNAATWHALRLAQQMKIAGTFFTWQNLHRSYPPPFRWFEQANYRATSRALAGSQAAADVLRAKGYSAPIHLIPQFGVDPHVFSPAPAWGDARSSSATFQIGYAGGLVPEKGVDVLLRACAQLAGDSGRAWRLSICGVGAEREALEKLARELGIAQQVEFLGPIDSTRMAAFYRGLDILVLPSRRTPKWQEQFGRVLIEAMACGVPVLGSDSGEIPNVIGDAGLTFSEENVDALAASLQWLCNNADLRQRLGVEGRQRVLERYTMTQIARETVDVYRLLAA